MNTTVESLEKKKADLLQWLDNHTACSPYWVDNKKTLNEVNEQLTSLKMTTAYELAKQTLEVLDTQQAYFKKRESVILQRSKALEKELRRVCEAVVAQQRPVTKSLFDNSNTEQND